MASQKEMVIVLSRGLDDERSSVAFSIANASVASGFKVLLFLVSSGIDWARKGAADHTHLNPLDPPMKDMVNNFVAGGGVLQACPPCVKVRGYDASDLLDGVIMAGAPAMLEWVSRGAATLSF